MMTRRRFVSTAAATPLSVLADAEAQQRGGQPAARFVGWHVDHQPSSWDLVYRAEMTYAEMAPYSDFIKFIAYHDILGPRIRWWYLARLQSTVLSEITLEQSLDLYCDLFGYDKKVEPKVGRALREVAYRPPRGNGA
jgi:hypothetical protein